MKQFGKKKKIMTIVELQKDVLTRIMEVSEELEEKSSALMTKTGVEAKYILSQTEHLQQLLRQTADLAEQSKVWL